LLKEIMAFPALAAEDCKAVYGSGSEIFRLAGKMGHAGAEHSQI
jgi:hypothetical protein